MSCPTCGKHSIICGSCGQCLRHCKCKYCESCMNTGMIDSDGYCGNCEHGRTLAQRVEQQMQDFKNFNAGLVGEQIQSLQRRLADAEDERDAIRNDYQTLLDDAVEMRQEIADLRSALKTRGESWREFERDRGNKLPDKS